MKLTLKQNVRFDVSGIGSTLIDLTADVDEAFIKKFSLEKGRMQFVDDTKSAQLLEAMAPYGVAATPGGSSANTLAGVAAMGGRAALIGKVGADRYGDIYVEQSEAGGVKTFIARDPGLTGHAITLITPDGERTFAVNLGAAVRFSEADIDFSVIRESAAFQIEGYILEPENLKGPCMKAIAAAKESGTLVSIDLSDPSLIARIKDTLDYVVDEYADLVFANEEEAAAFTGKSGEDALKALLARCSVAVVKLGARGSLISDGGAVHRVKCYPASVVNTNGAGDVYAAGVLFGITRKYPIEKAGALGSYASSIVVSASPARLQSPLDPESVPV